MSSDHTLRKAPAPWQNRAIFGLGGLVGGGLLTLGILMGEHLPQAQAEPSPTGARAVAPAPAAPPEDAADVAEGIRSLKQFSRAFTAVADRVRPVVVSIQVERTMEQSQFSAFGIPNEGNPFGSPFDYYHPDRQGGDRRQTVKGGGSGIIVSSDGEILTNNHVVEGADRISVHTADGQEFEAEVRGTDPKSDLAVIKVHAKNLPVAVLGNSEEVDVGEWVVAIGHPYMLEYTVTAGIVSATGRSNFHKVQYEDFIQTDASINPGNSGGPLVNLNGEVIGINTMIDQRGPGLGFAIPSNMARKVKDQLVATGHVVRPWLGVRVQDVDHSMASALGYQGQGGALVTAVEPGSPAARAGIQAEDIITELDGKLIRDSSDLVKSVISKEVDQKVAVGIVREGKTHDYDVTTGQLPDDNQGEQPGKTSPDANVDLGIQVRPLTPQMALELNADVQQGVVVWRIDPAGAAFEAGLRRGDIILEVDRSLVKTEQELSKQLKAKKEGASLLKVMRGGAITYVALERP